MNDSVTLLHGGRSCSIYLREIPGREKRTLKIINSDYPGTEELARLRNEYEIARDLDLPSCRKVYEETLINGRPALVMEHIDGISLKESMVQTRRTVEEAVILSIDIIRAVGDLHGSGVIHKDINSSNIMISREDGRVRLIDFGISSRTNLRISRLGYPDALEGTLGYISPEQTGRMNRVVDYRTDYYSYGVLLYELFTGMLPFHAEDPVKLIYAHIASVPKPPHEIVPELGENLSKIILKLMSKNAEDRYRSMAGIVADLESCTRAPDERGEWIPARYDMGDRFLIPEKLYGRTAQRDLLLSTFERVCEKGAEMMLVTGYAGVGKSSLVYEIHRPVTAKNAFFVSGKFDQFRQNIPYSAIVQAVEEYVKYLLTEPSDRFRRHQERILGAVGKNGRALTDLIPDLELIIGKQEPVPVLGPMERANRLKLLFLNFIRSISPKDHPLVLFIDDLQWIDLSSLDIIKLLLDGSRENPLFLIGAYRDNEVGRTHPLMHALGEIDPEKLSFAHLDNLAETDILQMISHALSSDPDRVAPWRT